MKRPLKSCDIKEGKRYRIIAVPSHWPKHISYPMLNKVGVAKWTNVYGVGLVIDERYDRIVPVECLEEIVYKIIPTIRQAKVLPKMEVTKENIKIGGRYQIVKIPHFWPENEPHPALGRVGRVKNVYQTVALMTIDSENDQRLLSFDCIKEVGPVEIDESYLIKQIRDNPWGALKLMKGLAKMNKDMGCRTFVERGAI